MTPEEIAQALRLSPLCSDFPDAALLALAPYFQMISGVAGAHLFGQGATSNALYVIVSGQVSISIRDTMGALIPIQTLSAPQSFGELSPLLRGDRLVEVNALDPVVLLEFDINNFRALKEQNPELCLLLVMAIVRRFGRTIDQTREVLHRVTLQTLAKGNAG